MSESARQTVGIVGLGYVGLPLAGAFEAAGHRVVGFDIDSAKPQKLARADSYLPHLGQSLFDRLASSDRFRATCEEADLAECDAILVCVPTPVDVDRQPNLNFVRTTFEMIRRVHAPGCLVVLESTTWPGTTREVCLPILCRGGRTLGEDFFLAFAPEREDPGREEPMRSVPRLVGGLDEASQGRAVALYEQVCDAVVSVSSAEVAEAAKLLENTYRAVNIALVNEYKMILEQMGIDIHEVVDAAATKPFGFSRFDPGPGLGGHCIPVDPWYFAWAANRAGHPSRFVELAGEINAQMPKHAVNAVVSILAEDRVDIQGASVLILGVAYKKNVGDVRETPAAPIVEDLRGQGATVMYHDPLVPEFPKMRRFDVGLSSVPLTETLLRQVDAVLIVADHDLIDFDLVAEHASRVVDTRCALSPGDVKGTYRRA
ncbi:MAG: UDP-N-acetyl-D-glucosamine dehydrogenase [Phycisphaerae bacterium]|nr:UDP-N-acetyl-D-glucosamine dehydrogenase [Phycisphaerae bacterium]